VRSYSPVYTIGGGVVLDALPPRRTTLRPHERELLEALIAHDLSSASVGLLAARGLPMTSAEVAAALGVPRPKVADELNRGKLERLKVGTETAFITPEALEHLLGEIERALIAFHDADPQATGIATAALRDRVDRRLSAKAFDALLALAAERGAATIDRGQVRHPKAAVSALADEQAATKALRSLLERQGLSPAAVPQLAEGTGVAIGLARKVLGQLVASGEVVRLAGDLYFSASAIETARLSLVDFLAKRPEGATTAELKEPLGVSRKYALPLLEYFDVCGVTKREGDLRVLR